MFAHSEALLRVRRAGMSHLWESGSTLKPYRANQIRQLEGKMERERRRVMSCTSSRKECDLEALQTQIKKK